MWIFIGGAQGQELYFTSSISQLEHDGTFSVNPRFNRSAAGPKSVVAVYADPSCSAALNTAYKAADDRGESLHLGVLPDPCRRLGDPLPFQLVSP